MVGMVEGSDEVCGRGVMSMTSKEASVLRRCKRSCRGGFRRTGQKAPWLVFFALLMLMSPAGSFSPPTPAVGSGRHAVRQHAMLGNIREGMSGALISFFGSRLTPVSFGGGGGRAESTSMRRVINADQEDAELVIIRTMEASDMKGADSKLMDAAKLCVSEMFGTNEGWDAVGQGFLLKYGKKLDNMGLSLMPAPEYSHGMCTMLSAELASGELVGCAGVDLARITAKGTPAWSGVHDVALLRPFLSDLVVRNSHRYHFLPHDGTSTRPAGHFFTLHHEGALSACCEP